METALLNYFVLNDEVRSSCDFNPYPLQNGLSIYEVVRIQDGIPLFLELHIERFYASASLESLKIPFEPESLKHRLKALIEYNKISQGNIKFLLHKSAEGDTRFMAWLMPFFYPSDKQYKEGVKVDIMNARRPRPNAKKAMYQLRERADAFIHEQNCFEVIYCNPDGLITEGSRSNVFFVAASQIVTAERTLVLPGVTRDRIMALALEMGFCINETKINLKQLPDFDACFLTGTSLKVLPVAQFHTNKYDPVHPVVRELMKAYDLLTESYFKKFIW